MVCFPAGWAEFMRDEETVVRSLCIIQISLICYKSTERFSRLYERFTSEPPIPCSACFTVWQLEPAKFAMSDNVWRLRA